jgi:KDO2-lipid IV(A) lauroyltransferase
MSADTNPPGADECAAAVARLKTLEVPWFGKWLYHLFPYRRDVVFGNMRRVFGDRLTKAEYVRLAQAYYGHYVRFMREFFTLPWMSAEGKIKLVRIENVASPLEAHKKGKGLILLTGHFGNWEVSTVAGIQQFPEFKGLFHFVRRPLKPKIFNDFVTRRFQKAGFGTIAKRGSLDQILDLLGSGAIVVYVFDQHAGGKDGIPIEFFGALAGTFKSPALIALASGAPVIPACSWREPDGTHVLRFEDPVELAESDDDGGEAIRRTTRRFNAALERMVLGHPEQWIWMHKRWKWRG